MMAVQPTSTNPSSLASPIQFFKGVGPYKAELLKKLDIETIEDILFHFPRLHQDRRVVSFSRALIGQKRAFIGIVVDASFNRIGKSLGQFRIRFKDSTSSAKVFFNAVWFKHLSYQYDVFSALKKASVAGQQLFVYGEVFIGRDGLGVKVEDWESLEPGEELDNGFVPVYPLSEGIHDRWFRLLAETIVKNHACQVEDLLPNSIRQEQRLMSLSEAISGYHFPSDLTVRDRARERLAFDEFFFLELALAMNRQSRDQSAKGYSAIPTRALLTPFKRQLKYSFTRSQIRVINEIFQDMARPQPMNRLLQGDVGSGKTVVALSAALLAIENGRQVAFLAPTEILAQQHYFGFLSLLADLKVRIGLLTGALRQSERKKILAVCAQGQLDLVIGTHALLTDDVQFNSLGLVVIDEQHRFGVRQRASLLQKANKAPSTLVERLHPDVLCMTATPIPRTLALTLYGDLDVSTIDQKPPGRSIIHTALEPEEMAFTHLQEVLRRGEQAYVVFPVIEESSSQSMVRQQVRSLKGDVEKLKQRFSQSRFALLHGRMPSSDKKSIMEAFRNGDVDVLVATPVIEVGIDVPNATLMIIYSPERFGLAALHQLRGRVGRGPKPSSCVLVADKPLDENSSRLMVFCNTDDGFKLAEEDLRSRGPGEFLGESQHGIPFFKVADLINDTLLLARARTCAEKLVHGKTPLTMREFRSLNMALHRRFGKNLHLSQVG